MRAPESPRESQTGRGNVYRRRMRVTEANECDRSDGKERVTARDNATAEMVTQGEVSMGQRMSTTRLMPIEMAGGGLKGGEMFPPLQNNRNNISDSDDEEERNSSGPNSEHMGNDKDSRSPPAGPRQGKEKCARVERVEPFDSSPSSSPSSSIVRTMRAISLNDVRGQREGDKETKYEDEERKSGDSGSEEDNNKKDVIARGQGLCGLANLGNTCYMNSVLQALSHCERFSSFFYLNRHQRLVNKVTSTSKGELVGRYADVVRGLWSRDTRSPVRPAKFKKCFGSLNPMFSGYAQHDAHDFLRSFLGLLEEDLNQVTSKIPYEEIKDHAGEPLLETAKRWWQYYEKRNDSFIKDLFAGQLASTVTCQKCNHQSHAFDPMLDLSVPLPEPGFGSGKNGTATIEDCLRLYTAQENLDDKVCSKCKSPCARTTSIFRCPQVLVLHLKRFKQIGARRSKLNSKVSLPIGKVLDLEPFCYAASPDPVSDDSAIPIDRSRMAESYRLVSVVHHSGSLDGGHYIASCNVGRENQWYTFNDSIVSKEEPERESTSAYLLFFESIGNNRKSNL